MSDVRVSVLKKLVEVGKELIYMRSSVLQVVLAGPEAARR
jgi:hypothetical protein